MLFLLECTYTNSLSDTSTIRNTLSVRSYLGPGYGRYNYVNLCYCHVLSNELDSQIHWSLVPRREAFVSVPKNLQSTIYEISSNQANFNENPSMQAEL